MRNYWTIILLGLTINVFSQRELKVVQSDPIIWNFGDISYNDTTLHDVRLQNSPSIIHQSKIVRVELRSINSMKFDTVIYYHWWQKKRKLRLDKVVILIQNESESLVQSFLRHSDQVLCVSFDHWPQGCDTQKSIERLILSKKDDLIYCNVYHQEDYSLSNDSTWFDSKIVDKDFIYLIDSLERKGFNSNTSCSPGFIGQDCGKFVFILDNKVKSFTNDLSVYNGIAAIQEKYLNIEQ